jgi:hypothetical protein
MTDWTQTKTHPKIRPNRRNKLHRKPQGSHNNQITVSTGATHLSITIRSQKSVHNTAVVVHKDSDETEGGILKRLSRYISFIKKERSRDTFLNISKSLSFWESRVRLEKALSIITQIQNTFKSPLSTCVDFKNTDQGRVFVGDETSPISIYHWLMNDLSCKDVEVFDRPKWLLQSRFCVELHRMKGSIASIHEQAIAQTEIQAWNNNKKQRVTTKPLLWQDAFDQEKDLKQDSRFLSTWVVRSHLKYFSIRKRLRMIVMDSLFWTLSTHIDMISISLFIQFSVSSASARERAFKSGSLLNNKVLILFRSTVRFSLSSLNRTRLALNYSWVITFNVSGLMGTEPLDHIVKSESTEW